MQRSRNGRRVRIVIRVAHTIVNNDFCKIKRTDIFQTCYIDAKFIGVRSSFMVRVYSACFAEIMLSHMRVKRIKRQVFCT